MWIKINNDKQFEEFVEPVKILDYNQIIDITSFDVNSARNILTLYGGNQRITCKPLKGDYPEWLSMLKYARTAVKTPVV